MPTVIVTGLADLQRNIARSGPEVAKAMRLGLREAADPVSKTAQALSLKNIRHMPRSPGWAENRIGVTRNAVYIVPKKRGIRGRGDDPRHRPNLVELMMSRAYTPALEAGTVGVELTVTRVIQETLDA